MKIVLIYSGGLDSTTLLYHLLSEGHEVKCLSIDYGQRHKKELEAAIQICKGLDIEHQIADLTGITHLIKGSSQSDLSVPVPEGYYAEENMKITVVPNRNMIMLSVAIGWAVSSKFDAVAYGAHAGDHLLYRDCRPEFAAAMDTTALLCDEHQIKLIRPFIDKTKEDIVQIGLGLGVPFEKTWTCYKGEKLPCGVCGSCQERRAAFKAAEAKDPVKYKSYKIYKKQGHEVKCLSIDYGQRHKKELEAAIQICKGLDIEHQIADLTGITHLIKGSSQHEPNIISC